MDSGPYFPGSTTTLVGSFAAAETGGAVDPALVTLTVQRPDGGVDTPSVTRIAAGQYQAEYTMPVAGIYTQRWEGSAPYAQVAEARFEVLPSGMESP